MSAQLHRLWVLTMVLALGFVILFVVVMNQSRHLRFAGMPRVKMMSGQVSVDQNTAPDGFQVYRDPAGEFSFLHPVNTWTLAATTTSRAVERSITLISAPPEETPIPDMIVYVGPGKVRFEAWEGLEVPYFHSLVESFRFTK